jgi:hypothetical protein
VRTVCYLSIKYEHLRSYILTDGESEVYSTPEAQLGRGDGGSCVSDPGGKLNTLN